MTTMATATKEKSTYREAWEESQRRAAAVLPAWASRQREAAFETFERVGFPTTELEDWKYTNVAPIARTPFAAPRGLAPNAGEAQAAALSLYPEAERSRLVFVNGYLSASLSSLDALPAGVTVTSLWDALSGEHAELLRERVGEAAVPDTDGFAALNAAHLGEGAFVFLPK